MSLEYIKELVNNKYYELYNINNEEIKAIKLEEFIYDSLSKYNKNKVMYFIKQLFNIEIQFIKEDSKTEKTQNKICRNDDEFKKAVHSLYKTCIICNEGDCHKSAYEIAHIWDFANCDSLESKYDVNNGILLCANMHKYFDSKCRLLKFEVIKNIDDDSNNVLCKIVFCESISDSSYYKKYNGKQIKFNKQNIMYLDKKNLEIPN
jgi:predicted restriction endonuclease